VKLLLAQDDTLKAKRIPGEMMEVRISGGGLRAKVCPWKIQLERLKNETRLLSVDAVVLYSTEGPR
jgi:hypothetical protein